MLLRLKVSGFKNLLDLDVRFGPFTCIAGPNGIGKSNLFDAIRFLGLLADRPLVDAAAAVRDSGRRAREISDIFYRSGDFRSDRMEFEMDLLVPKSAIDDFGQEGNATNTLLRYALAFGYRNGAGRSLADQLVLLKEELRHIPAGQSTETLAFPHKKAWRDSVVEASRRAPFFISTDPKTREVKIHQDGGARGRPLSYPSENMKRTVLAASNAAESPTVFVLRREMQSWLHLQLEPTSLRRPDEFTDDPHLTASGEHLPATLDRLAQTPDAHAFYATLSNRLSELVGDVRDVRAVRDDARNLITAQVTFADGTPHPAMSLSDGTLRFLALAILEQDPDFTGLLCLEEPENGIHPERIPAMIRLLQDLAVDASLEVGPDNPLRQVIVNTHSPICVAEVPETSLLLAQLGYKERADAMLPTMELIPLPSTWRQSSCEKSIRKGEIHHYLNPISQGAKSARRVIDRPELQMSLFGSGER